MVDPLKLGLESVKDLGFVKISLTEIQTTQINTKSTPCKSYSSNEQFIECFKKSFWPQITPRVDCMIAGLKMFMPTDVSLPRCANATAAKATLVAIDFSAVEQFPKILKDECPQPCVRRSFTAKLKSFHKNSYFEFNENSKELMDSTVSIFFTYATLLVEQRVENFVYDFVTMLAAVGGNLGLFLGFSCFSTVMFLAHILAECFQRLKIFSHKK